LNQGRGTFSPETWSVQFANVPQGKFTGAAVADYDRDGWLDIYFWSLTFIIRAPINTNILSPIMTPRNGPPNVHDAEQPRRIFP